MPFIRVSVEAYDEILEEIGEDELPPDFAANRPSGEFEYEPASARFTPDELGPVAQRVLETLLDAGATAFRIRYDGGWDEGFAYPAAFLFGDAARSVEEVLKELASPALIQRVRQAAGIDSQWGNATELYQNASLAQAATYALDELAGSLAVRLLGSGFGTGEYDLYGLLTANLRTGELVDDPEAPRPESMK